MSYHVRLTRQAEKAFDALMTTNVKLGHRIANAIERIAEDPNSGTPLKGMLKGLWKYRIGTYRIIYQIERTCITITIIDIAHRRDVYR